MKSQSCFRIRTQLRFFSMTHHHVNGPDRWRVNTAIDTIPDLLTCASTKQDPEKMRLLISAVDRSVKMHAAYEQQANCCTCTNKLTHRRNPRLSVPEFSGARFAMQVALGLLIIAITIKAAAINKHSKAFIMEFNSFYSRPILISIGKTETSEQVFLVACIKNMSCSCSIQNKNCNIHY